MYKAAKQICRKKSYFWAYVAGAIVFEIITDVVLAIITGGATAVVKSYTTAIKSIKALARKVGKQAINIGNDLIKWLQTQLDELFEALKNNKLSEWFSKKIDEVFGDKKQKLSLDELIKSIPNINSFNKWYNELSVEDFDILWSDVKAKSKIIGLIRHPGGLHEWLMCSRANTLKKWNVSMDEIKLLRTKIEEVIFKNPPGYHGGPGSTKAHNEILKIIDSSDSYKIFKGKLIEWAENRLINGKDSLPKEFFN